MNDSPTAFSARLSRLMRLVRKETTGVLRDRRTIVTLFLMPVLLYPLLAICFRQFFLSQKAEQATPTYRVGIQSENEAEAIITYLQEGRRSLAQSIEANGADSGKDLEPVLRFLQSDDPESDVQADRLDLAIRPGPGHLVLDPRRDLHEQWELIYRHDSAYGKEALQFVERLVAASNEQFLRARLFAAGIRQTSLPVTLRTSTIQTAQASKTGTLAILIPLILILMTITGGVYPAIDLTAGERERGTLEILMAAPVPRLSLLFAKYVAVLTVALLTAIVNLSTMMVTLMVSGLGPIVFRNGLTLEMVFSILALLVLFAGFFSAVLLALTSFARSFKEAQAYLIPLMLVSMGPGMLSLMPGIKLQGFLIIAPLINIVLLARDVLQGEANVLAAAAVILSTSLYALAALALAARLFGAEAVLFTDQGTWSDLWRRPTKTSARATPAAALFCLALLFPAYFVTTGGGSQLLQGTSLQVHFAFISLASALLFAGFPLLAAYLGRIRLQSGFRLARPGILTLVSGVLLGSTLWPFAHELTLLLRHAGLSTLSPEIMEKLHDAVAGWRALPLIWPILAIGIVPPLVEEFFFRGYLLTALLALGRPIWGILSSAILFGLFHLLVVDSFAFERFIPTTLLGLLLGWIAWRTGSIWPGAAMHITHNSLIVLLGYYEERLEQAGWDLGEDSHLPIGLLAAAAAGAALGIAGIWWSRGDRKTANMLSKGPSNSSVAQAESVSP